MISLLRFTSKTVKITDACLLIEKLFRDLVIEMCSIKQWKASVYLCIAAICVGVQQLLSFA